MGSLPFSPYLCLIRSGSFIPFSAFVRAVLFQLVLFLFHSLPFSHSLFEILFPVPLHTHLVILFGFSVGWWWSFSLSLLVHSTLEQTLSLSLPSFVLACFTVLHVIFPYWAISFSLFSLMMMSSPIPCHWPSSLPAGCGSFCSTRWYRHFWLFIHVSHSHSFSGVSVPQWWEDDVWGRMYAPSSPRPHHHLPPPWAIVSFPILHFYCILYPLPTYYYHTFLRFYFVWHACRWCCLLETLFSALLRHCDRYWWWSAILLRAFCVHSFSFSKPFCETRPEGDKTFLPFLFPDEENSHACGALPTYLPGWWWHSIPYRDSFILDIFALSQRCSRPTTFHSRLSLFARADLPIVVCTCSFTAFRRGSSSGDDISPVEEDGDLFVLPAYLFLPSLPTPPPPDRATTSPGLHSLSDSLPVDIIRWLFDSELTVIVIVNCWIQIHHTTPQTEAGEGPYIVSGAGLGWVELEHTHETPACWSSACFPNSFLSHSCTHHHYHLLSAAWECVHAGGGGRDGELIQWY